MNSNKSEAEKQGHQLEYTALRAEILKRIELRQQLMSITLTLAGAFMGFGLSNHVLALIYSPVALFLAMLWVQNDIRSRQIGKYIQQLETVIPGLCWESHYRQEKEAETRFGSWPLSVLAPGGTFVATEAIAIGVGIAGIFSKSTFTIIEWSLLTVNVIAILSTLSLLVSARKQSKKYRQ